MKREGGQFRGCILGGAVGDALGWPVEFLSLNDIQRKYGPNGIEDLQLNHKGESEITDDTQMTLFTAEGILRSDTLNAMNMESDPVQEVFEAYERWLMTQGFHHDSSSREHSSSWLLDDKRLHANRAPGNTCISALKGGVLGTRTKKINNSKGCGGIMRVSPGGLFYRKEEAFVLGADFAAITHSHPSGYLSAGALSFFIACLVEGMGMDEAVLLTMRELGNYKGHEECLEILVKAVKLSAEDMDDLLAIPLIGEGWVGEETLAIAVYAALKYRNDFEKALLVSVNHDGDSDSTGAVTGNILGAYLGIGAIPERWLERLELRDVLYQTADDLFTGYQDTGNWMKRYPVVSGIVR